MLRGLEDTNGAPRAELQIGDAGKELENGEETDDDEFAAGEFCFLHPVARHAGAPGAREKGGDGARGAEAAACVEVAAVDVGGEGGGGHCGDG